MQRKDFLKSACTIGMCSCAGLSIFSGSTLLAAGDDKEKKEADWHEGFIQKRFASLVKNLDAEVTAEQKEKILENLGRTCAEESKGFYVKYIGDIKGFLDAAKKSWADSVEFNEDEKYIRIIGKKIEKCACPFVDSNLMSKDFCDCTLGWNKHVYSAILGKPVNAIIEESLLKGGTRCTIRINYA